MKTTCAGCTKHFSCLNFFTSRFLLEKLKREMLYIDEEVEEHMFSNNETRRTSIFTVGKVFSYELHTLSFSKEVQNYYQKQMLSRKEAIFIILLHLKRTELVKEFHHSSYHSNP